MLKSNRIQYWFLMALNIAVALVYAAAYFEFEVEFTLNQNIEAA
jgi:hypothetical protein